MTLKPHWTQARPSQTNAALILIGAGMFLLSRQLVVEYHHFHLGFSGVSGWSAILYLCATWLILTQPVDRLTLPIILTVAIACRLAPLPAEPYLSSDIYRYVWDGIVQHAHISPYRYVPGDPALTFLRAPHQQIFDHINRRDYAHTIYPPAAQLLFYLITFISPTVTFMKIVMVLFEGVTLYALIQLLQHLGLRREQSLLYAWCPLLIWEIAGAGHLDSAAMAYIALALLFRYRRQPILTGIFLGLAIATKLYPLVLLPALVSRNPRRRLDLKMPITAFSVVAIGYAAYSSVGKLVFGFLGGYVQEEGLNTGTRYFFLELAQHIPGLHHLPIAVFYILCIAIFAALTAWAIQQGTATTPGAPFMQPHRMSGPSRSEPHSSTLQIIPNASFLPAFALATALMFLFSPHYPWYILWLIPFFTLLPNLPILAYLMTFFYLFTTQLADGTIPHMFLINKILYGTTAVALIIQLVLTRWPIHQPLFPRPTKSPTLSPRPE